MEWSPPAGPLSPDTYFIPNGDGRRSPPERPNRRITHNGGALARHSWRGVGYRESLSWTIHAHRARSEAITDTRASGRQSKSFAHKWTRTALRLLAFGSKNKAPIDRREAIKMQR